METNEIFLYVYDKSFTLLGIVDRFISLVWADRYDECGDFELVVPYSESYKNLLKKGLYCTTDYTKHHAIIERIEIENDNDGNYKMTVTGRTIEIILDTRVVLNKMEIGKEEPENLEQAIKNLLNDNAIEPNDEDRVIPGLIFVNSDDDRVFNLKLVDTFDKDSLYEVISKVCQDKHIGFRILINDNNEYEFLLFKGRDLSNEVLFSAHYGNLNDSKYFSSIEEFKNVMVISKNEDEVLTVTNEDAMPRWLDRKEIYKSASSLKENTEGSLSDQDLEIKGINELNFKYKVQTGFDGEIIPGMLHTYLEDYDVGDKVLLEDEYDNNEVVYISEVVISFDEKGFSIVPTFKEINWDENEYESEE